MPHYTLDADPEPLRRAARRLAELEETLRRRGSHATSAPERWRGGWRSPSSELIGGEARTLGGNLTGFAERLGRSREAITELADAVETARTVDLPDLNRRWREAHATYDAAVGDAQRRKRRSVDDLDPALVGSQRKQALEELDEVLSTGLSVASGQLGTTLAKLDEEYEALKERLRRAARRTSTALGRQVPVPVTPAQVAAQNVPGLAQLVLSGLSNQAASTLGGPLEQLRSQLANPPQDASGLGALLERARQLGVPPQQYATVLQSYWAHRAAEEAGIDLDAWDPTEGAALNKSNIEAVYAYYARLYLKNPDLQWAGMANMIGPSFAAGFFDLSLFRRIAEAATEVPEPLRSQLPEGIEDLADLPEDELRFYETTFLDMQKQIFLDQGTAHQAYVDGGMRAIREMEAAGLLPKEVADAWADLDTGDPAKVQRANEVFLLREQRVIIEDDYQKMYHHSPSGEAMTWMMTFIGAPSIPDAKGYPDTFPLEVTVDTPGPERIGTPDRIGPFDVPSISVDNPTEMRVKVKTPFPDGNIAHFDDRWALIAEDTLPRFQELLRDDPDRARELIGSDVADRISEYRLHRRVDEIVGQLGDWDVDVDQ